MKDDETLAEWLRRTDELFIAGAVMPDRLCFPTAVDFNDLREELRKPTLETATTRELLEELRKRGVERGDDHLVSDAVHLLGLLAPEVLDYPKHHVDSRTR